AASLAGGGSGSGARQADVKNVTVGRTGGGSGNAAAAMPQVAAGPKMAVMPKPKASSPAAARSGSPAASAPAGAGSATCTHPSYVTSDQYGMWNQAPYFVYNNMWGISGYSVSQTLYACSYGNW